MTGAAVLATVDQAGPYKGLEHFGEHDAPYFFGRDEETEIVVANVLAARLTLLYGESGVGKSSLLHAGVLPRLRSLGELEPLIFSAWREDPVAALARAVRELAGWESAEYEPPLHETLAESARRLERDLIVILDQFEEYFVYHSEEDGPGTFAREFPRAVALGELPVSFLVSIREDALAKLDRFKGRIPNLFDTYLRVEHLDREEAREAIERPLEEWDRRVPPEQRVEIEPALVPALLDEVTAGRIQLAGEGIGVVDDGSTARARVETPYLQLVLGRLWQEEERTGSRTLQLETLRRLGGANRIVQTHLDIALATLPLHQQEVAAAVFRFLVTPSGTKIAHRVGDLAEYADLPAADVEAVLAQLATGEARILRPVAESTYEIYHDVLASAILDWRARFASARQQEELERRRRGRMRIGTAIAAPLLAAAIAVPLALWRIQADRQSDAEQEATSAYYRAVLIGHKDIVNHALFSPDGKRVATASDDGTARVWQATTTGPPLAVLHAGERLADASFTPDGRLLVTGGEKGRVRFWNSHTGREVREPLELDAGVNRISFNRRGDRMIVASDFGGARIWEWPSGRQVTALVDPGEVYEKTRSAAFNREGTLVVVTSDDGRARVWNLTGPHIIAALRVARDPNVDVIDAEFSPDGRYVVTASDDGRTIVWDWGAKKRVEVLPGESYWLSGAEFSPSGTLVVTAGGSDNVVANIWPWRVRRKPSVALKDHTDSVESAEFSPDGRLIVTASADHTARVWTLPGSGDLFLRPVRAHEMAGVVIVDCDITNVGGAATPATNVRAEVTGLAVGSAPVPRLAIGATAHVRLRLAVRGNAGRGAVLVQVVVDPSNSLSELSEKNNDRAVHVRLR